MVGEPGAADANELPAQVVTLRYPLTLPLRTRTALPASRGDRKWFGDGRSGQR